VTRDPFVLPGDEPPVGEKLQKFLSTSGVASRRHAEVMIRQGRVTVNGEVATLGMRVVEGDEVRVGGVEVGPQAPRFFLLNKPTGVVTTLDDPQGRPTVATLVPDDVRVYPVGRLDVDTSGLLLLTNDGELAHRLMHPSFGIEKSYRVLVAGGIAAATVRRLAEGIELEDGPTAPATARIIDAGARRSVIELTIHEGRNRQVRRMCDAVGHPVIELVRTGYGPLTLSGVAPGEHRKLTDQEIRRLRKVTGLAPARSGEREGSRAERRAAARAASEQEALDREGKADAGARGDADQGQQPKRGPGAAPRSSGGSSDSGGGSGGGRAGRGRSQRGRRDGGAGGGGRRGGNG
jgi:23S rRNA pseudouridine2605 synthase